jgi:hypothetical protein
MPRIENHYGSFIIYGRGYGREGTLVQTDWDWPATAEIFGWSTRRVQRRDGRTIELLRLPRKYFKGCPHAGTDGTVNCPECGVTAHEFIESAGRFLDSIAF